MNLREIARRYHAAGLNVLPADRKQKRPLRSWKKWVEEKPAFDLVFPSDLQFNAICVVCGKTSGGLEIIDFDQKATAFDGWAGQLPPDLSDVLNGLPTETTQSGGRHVAYRCGVYEGNQKLARNANGTTIETRGQGGICLISPSDGYELSWGDWENVPTISDDQRRRLLEAARNCDATQPNKKQPNMQPKKEPNKTTRIASTATAPASTFTGESVADYLRNNLDIIRQALTRAGWEFLRVDGDFEQWARPGQPQAGKLGGSLCINPQSDGYACFHCFTSNAAPLTVDENYSPLDLIAALEFNGDSSTASKAYAPNRHFSVIECVNPYDVPIESLEMNADGVAYSAPDPLDFCIQRQRARLERDAMRRTAVSLEEIDVEALNRSFPLETLPISLQTITRTMGDRYGTPYATIAAVGLSAISGVLGCYKSEYLYNGVPVNPLIHTFIVAAKGAGKSETINAFLAPIAAQIEPGWEIWRQEQSRNMPFLYKRFKELEGKKTLTDDEKKEAIIIPMIQRLIEWGGERIRLGGSSSIEALWYQSAMN